MSKIDLVVRISSGNACHKVGAASAKERSTKVTKVLIQLGAGEVILSYVLSCRKKAALVTSSVV